MRTQPSWCASASPVNRPSARRATCGSGSPSAWRVTPGDAPPRRLRPDPRAPRTQAKAGRPDQAAPARGSRCRDDRDRDRSCSRHGGARCGNGSLRELRPERAATRRDRPELVRLRLGRVAARLDPGRAEPRAGHDPEHVAVASEVDDGDRGPALLGARCGRLRRHRACGVEGPHRGQGPRGRLDDHAAARPQPLHRPGEDVHAQDQGGLPRDQAREQVAEAEDSQRVPQHRLLREPRVRRRGGLADVLLQAREPADTAAVRAARRTAAGAVGVRPVPQSAGRARSSRRGAPGAVRQPRHHARAVPAGDSVDARSG